MALAQTVRELFRELGGEGPLTRMTPLDALVGGSVAFERFRSRFVGAFAIVAIVLAVVGIYGVRAFTVGQRYRELGIRLVLGAPPREIVRLVASQGMALSMTGLAVGGVAALYISRAMSALLFRLPTAAVLMLSSLAEGPRHGYAIRKDIARRSGDDVKPGITTLYRLLKQLLDDGLVEESSTGPAPRAG